MDKTSETCLGIATDAMESAAKEIIFLRKRLEKCEAALQKARMLLISEGDPDEDSEIIAEIDELLENAARAAKEE